MSEIWTPTDEDIRAFLNVSRRMVTGITQLSKHGLHTAQILDMPMQHAINEIYDKYGDVVRLKPKSLTKFGRTSNADSGVLTEVQSLLNSPRERETTGNTIETISSQTAGDTQTISIEGHTVANSALTFAVQQVTLQGQTPVPLTTKLYRVTRAENRGNTDIGGEVYIYETSAVTAGQPVSQSSVHLVIKAGENRSQKAKTAFSNEDYGIITGVYAGINKSAGNTVTADFQLQIREFGKTYQEQFPINLRTEGAPSEFIPLSPHIIVPKNADVRLVVETNTNDTNAVGFFQTYIALVQSSAFR